MILSSARTTLRGTMQPQKTIAGDYGSDRHGLVWGLEFHANGTVSLIDAEQAAVRLAAHPPDGGFCWLHFSLANIASERWLRQFADLPDAFYECLRAEGVSTRVEQAGDALLAVVNDVLFDFRYDVSDVATMVPCVRPGLVVSARLKPLRSVDRLRESVKAGLRCRSPVFLLARLLENQANVLLEIVRQVGGIVDGIEDSILISRVTIKRGELAAQRRLLVRLQRLLAPEPAALFRLLGRPPRWIPSDELQDLRQSAEEFSAVVAECSALVDRVKLIQEELADTINEQNSRSLFLLTFATVLLMPFNVVGGLFGMNVGGIPFATSSAGFWVIIVVVTALTGTLTWALIRQFRR